MQGSYPRYGLLSGGRLLPAGDTELVEVGGNGSVRVEGQVRILMHEIVDGSSLPEEPEVVDGGRLELPVAKASAEVILRHAGTPVRLPGRQVCAGYALGLELLLEGDLVAVDGKGRQDVQIARQCDRVAIALIENGGLQRIDRDADVHRHGCLCARRNRQDCPDRDPEHYHAMPKPHNVLPPLRYYSREQFPSPG